MNESIDKFLFYSLIIVTLQEKRTSLNKQYIFCMYLLTYNPLS